MRGSVNGLAVVYADGVNLAGMTLLIISFE
jgi:hypothetical protein